MKRRLWVLIALVAVIGAGLVSLTTHRARPMVLTGIVSTDDVIVSSEIQGRLQTLKVREGDTVKAGELLGEIKPEEWQAGLAFYNDSAQQSAAQLRQAEADLRYEKAESASQIKLARANLASAQAQAAQGKADLENARLNFQRESELHQTGVDSPQAYDQARTSYASARAHVDALNRQVEAAAAALASAEANADQVAGRRAAVQAGRHQFAAAEAQREKARVQLGYTEIRAPIDGVVDVRAALPGEVVDPGQAIVTLINPDDLWVRVDVPESDIDRIHLGEKLQVRLPSGATRVGTVFFRGVDADYATQRDVSRTKRDIKTFQVRLRCDNRDRSLAVGMTAYVTLPPP